MIIPIIFVVATVIIAYLLGSISFAVIFTKVFVKTDIREEGSGNAGATNVMRVGGFWPGALTFLCDALKGFVACALGKYIFLEALWSDEWSIYGAFFCGVACMLGHVFPIFFQFKGGKGIATSVGIFAVCNLPAIVCGLVVFAVSVLITRIVSLSSMLATVAVVSLTMIFYNHDALFWPQAVFAVLMGIIVVLKHLENIKRLISKTEKKLTIRGQKQNG